jgi:molecular chaperone DnaJ
MQSYYDLLGITPAADLEQVKSAYRRLAKACHPDLHSGDPLATRRFSRLNKAYEVLASPELRSAYNAHLERLRARTPVRRTVLARAVAAGFQVLSSAMSR